MASAAHFGPWGAPQDGRGSSCWGELKASVEPETCWTQSLHVTQWPNPPQQGCSHLHTHEPGAVRSRGGQTPPGASL